MPTKDIFETAVVTGYDFVKEAALFRGFSVIENNAPEETVSRTINLAVEHFYYSDAILFMVSDQPLLRMETVSKLINFFLEDPAEIAAVSSAGVRGNPAIFPKKYFDALKNLPKGKGGSFIMKSAPVRRIEVDGVELTDIDTLIDLKNLNNSKI